MVCYHSMKKETIVKYPNPVLRKKCEEVKEITEEIKTLALDMVQILEASQGLGLAASQMGELKRIIVVHPIQERTPEEKTAKPIQIFINPKMTKKSKKTEVDEEGCLSFPGLFLKIKRAKTVEVEALNLEGDLIKVRAEGLPARIFQHEIDHLDGILFIDRISFWRKLKLKAKV